MAWYVETLLMNREVLHASTLRRSEAYGDFFVVNLNGNDYNNLLILEKTIKELYASGNITDREIQVIEKISTAKSLRELEKEMNLARHSLSKIFYNVCEKLAFILGGEFTDEGYLKYIQKKYKLDEEQADKVREYMLQGSLNQT